MPTFSIGGDAQSIIDLVKDNVLSLFKNMDARNKGFVKLLLDMETPSNPLDQDVDLSEQILNIASIYAKDIANLMGSKVMAKDEPKQIVYGVVAEPGAVDMDGQTISAEHIEECAHRFLADFRASKVSHFLPIKADIVESYVIQQDWEAPDGQLVKKGSWVAAMKIYDQEIWKDTAIGGPLKGFSMGGIAFRV